MKRKKTWPLKIMNSIETIAYIKNNKCSISRFGDGEVDLMMLFSIPFQDASFKLRRELLSVIHSKNEDLLVALPYVINDTSKCLERSRNWWNQYFRYRKWIWKLFFQGREYYGDALVSRPWIDFQDEEAATLIFDSFKEIWENRDIVIVEGRKSRIGVGNDIFKNAKSIRRILGPEKNAYEKIDAIYDEVLKENKDSLIILALGPTATVLAYRLSKVGYQALDLGHFDVEYEWFKLRAYEKVPLKNKYVNESNGEKFIDQQSDIEEDYFKQIVCEL